MYRLKTVIVDISKLNKNDSLDSFTEKMPFEIRNGISEYVKALQKDSSGDGGFAFLITDNREAADLAKAYDIGISVYTNGENNPSDFPEALYCIDNLSEMMARTVERMYLRAENLPWEILRTENCIVREITLKDVDRLYEIYSDEDVIRYVENLYENREDEIQYTKEYITNQYRFFEYGLWIVENKDTHEIMGRAGIFDRPDQKLQELGFIFAKEYWGRGYAYECLSAIIDYVYSELDIDTLLAHAVHENERSKKLLEKLGFVFTNEHMVDGKKYDQYIYKSCIS